MYKGVLTTKQSKVEKQDSSFISILREMETLKREHSYNNIESIDIYENEKAIAALRLM